MTPSFQSCSACLERSEVEFISENPPGFGDKYLLIRTKSERYEHISAAESTYYTAVSIEEYRLDWYSYRSHPTQATRIQK